MKAVLIVPGLGDSGPGHWQTWWEAQDGNARRVHQTDWRTPELERWSARVGEAIGQAQGPVWLVAHSFGCLASVQAAAARPERVAGALLVAPASPAKCGLERSLPRRPLPFPSLVVASLDDPWLPFAAATAWSKRWGSRLVGLGHAGHINVDSGYGPWPEGRTLLEQLQATAMAGPAPGAPAFGPAAAWRRPAA
jgi:hypothetical protein